MAKLIISSGAQSREAVLDDKPQSIGRKPANRIVLDDPAVSGRHAHIYCAGGKYFIEDLQSSNGTRVNGQSIGKHSLQHGDVVQMGSHQIKFLSEDEKPDLLGTLVMMAPPKQEPPEPAAESAPQFRIEREAASAAPEPQARPAAAGAGSELDLLDELVGSIRSHRKKELSAKEQKQAMFQAEWQKVLQFAEQLRGKLQGDPRVLYFAIARGGHDVMMRIKPSPNAAVILIMLSPHHPDSDGEHDITGLWLRRTGEQDQSFPTADQLKADVIRSLAFILA